MAIEDWLEQARLEYNPQKIHESLGVITQTRFGSMLDMLQENNVSQLFKSKKINLLIVGPGGQSEMGYMPYELYEVTAYLESQDFDYNLTVLEILPKVAEKVLMRRKLGVSIWDLIQSDLATNFFEYSWPTYCNLVGSDSTTRRNQETFWTDIPKSLATKLDNGDVEIIVEDVASAQLPENTFDFVIARNVLYQVDQAGKKLAYHNLSKSMKSKGFLWTNYGMMINPSFITTDRQDQLYQQDWFRDLEFEKGPVLVRANGFPTEYLFSKK